MNTSCIFCKIANKEAPADVVYENDKVIVFKNIRPSTPIHLLAIPRKHIASVNEMKEEDKEIIGELFLAAKEATNKLGVKRSGYKLAVNVEKGGGQEIFHLHLHILSGWTKDEETLV